MITLEPINATLDHFSMTIEGNFLGNPDAKCNIPYQFSFFNKFPTKKTNSIY